MSVFEHKDGFRPRDQSVSTKLKYETEAKLWSDAFKASHSKPRSASFSETMGNLGLVISLLFNLILIVVLSLTNLFKWISKSLSIEVAEADSNTSSELQVNYTIDEFIEDSKNSRKYR